MATGNIRSTRKLKQWMIEKVDSGKFHGLVWDDTDRTSFRIPWKHAGKHDFRPDEDAALFKEWAIFKNKYKDGAKLEAAAWKTRLRCALNKSPEFAEVPGRSQLDISEPFKVYRLVPLEEQKGKPATTGRKRTLKEEARDVSSEDEVEPKKRSRSNHIIMEVKDEGEPVTSKSFYAVDSGIESNSNSPQRSSDSPQRDSGSPHRSFDSLQRSSESPNWSHEIELDIAEVEAIETPTVMEADLGLYHRNEGPQPKYKVTLCFGEEITENDQKENKLITLQVEQILARQQVLLDSQENFTNTIFITESVSE